MGIIRGGLIVIVSVLLFLSFIIATSFLVVSISLSYENVQGELTPVISDFLSEQMNLEEVSSEKMALMQLYCVNETEFVFSEAGETFRIPCSLISENSSEIIEEMVSQKVDEIYYNEYDCGFFDCFNENMIAPYFLISEHTRNYFENKFYLFATFCLILSAVIFFLVEKKSNSFFITGGLLTLSSFTFLKLDYIAEIFADKVMVSFFGFLFDASYSVALKGILLGILLMVFGLILKFFKIGFWLSNLLSKIKKERKDSGTAKIVTKKEVIKKKSDSKR